MIRLKFSIGYTCVLIFSTALYAGAQVPEFDEQRAWEHLIKQCAFGPRNPGSKAHKNCYDYLTEELGKYASSVQGQPFIAIDPYTKETYGLSNILATFWPDRSRRLFLCAHWDSRPWADQDPDPDKRKDPIVGANDGASGVAILLEIARCVAAKDPGIGIDIVLFDGEDMGREGRLDEYCLGSERYARNMSYPLPEAAVLLDMVGDADLYIPQELYSRMAASDLLNEIFTVAGELGENVFDSRSGQAVYDDHIHLLKAGVEAVNLIDFDYEYWHTVQDIPENCSPESLGSVGRVVLTWIYRRAGLR
jgi:hypothetical protein